MNGIRTLSHLIGLSALFLACSLSAIAQAPMKIGQAAPEFKAGRWVKHGPITRLEPGQIYLLEFWATWCGPCIAAMPHLTELAHKYSGKVTVIGVNILERGPAEKVDRNVDLLIEQKGGAADYPICRDTADDHLLKHWFQPTKSPGIPTTIVVDQQGRVAWIGHPTKVEGVIEELLAGKFDFEKSAAEHEKSAARSAAMMAVFKEYGAAMEAKDWAKAVKVVDDNPQYATTMWLMRFNAQLRLDAAEAFEQLKTVVAKKDRHTAYLGSVAQTEGLPRGMYQFALDSLLPEARPQDSGTLAELYYRLGDKANAVAYQLKLREFALGLPQRPAPAAFERIEEALKKYQADK